MPRKYTKKVKLYTETSIQVAIEELTDVITRNVPGIGMDERKTYWSLLHRMKLKSSMFLDILSQDLPKATDRDADELLQMIEDIQNQRQHVTTGTHAQANRRSQGLCDGYVGIIHFNRWKNSASQPSQPLDDLSQTGAECGLSCRTPAGRGRRRPGTAHAYLRKALKDLTNLASGSCYNSGRLRRSLHGQDSAIRVLEEYWGRSEGPPAHHLAYHFYRTLVPGSTQQQLTQLECIIKESPDDPLVVETVNLYLRTHFTPCILINPLRPKT
ncbi:hypothetical protein GWK47_022777 [Chionoecetes opilio]|uniref:Uncharacterized protein n=1 Tax=Chionoecetes opilio TaxID=41210 RepID=A0A8J4XQ85_CHIOP|nr:hypothetical protein GWK47_022777 [Chionoecetes opilio]